MSKTKVEENEAFTLNDIIDFIGSVEQGTATCTWTSANQLPRTAVAVPSFPPLKLGHYPTQSKSRRDERNDCLNLTKQFTKSEKVLIEKEISS